MPIAKDARPKPSADAKVKPIDDGGVVVDARTGKCWELNAVGFAIWQLIAEGRSISETVETVSTRYSISIAASSNDVMSFVKSLLHEGLLELPPAANGGAVAP